jgi:signal transduction protein with GAF and PtsI domain
MLGLTRKSRMERVRGVLGESLSYTNDLVHDKRLRSDVRSAIDHGSEAKDRFREDIGAERMAARLMTDRKLRKNLRALIDDIDRVSDRMRRRRSHRVRNAILIVAGTGAAVAIISPARRWVGSQVSGSTNDEPPSVEV